MKIRHIVPPLSLIFLSTFLPLIVSGCATATNNYAAHITPQKLEKRGMMVGRVTFEDTNRATKLGNLLMMNAQPWFQAKNSRWNTVATTITGGAEKGYFAIPVKPDSYVLNSLNLSPGFTRPWIQSMSVCCFGERFKQVSIGAGEIVYVGDIHFRILAKPEKQQLAEAIKSPLAPILVVAALTGDDEYLQIEVTDRFKEAIEYFSSKNSIEKSHLSKGLLVDPQPEKEAAAAAGAVS